jgi:hypothetical protein
MLSQCLEEIKKMPPEPGRALTAINISGDKLCALSML